jgi:hypothetical protein
MSTAIPSLPEPEPDDIERGLADLAAFVASAAAAPVDGYTDRVQQLEAAAAESEWVSSLPTASVLARKEELAEQAGVRTVESTAHADELRAKGDRLRREIDAKGEQERTVLTGQADRAAARRAVDTDPNVRALRLERQRRHASWFAGAIVAAASAFTCVNVQRFAAGDAAAWHPMWIVGWLADPLLTFLVVWLLWVRSDLTAVSHPIGTTDGRKRWLLVLIEAGALLSTVVMNISPELTVPRGQHVQWNQVVLHLVIPLAGVAAVFALPVVQELYARRIDALFPPADVPAETVVQTVHTPFEQPKLSDRAAAALPVVNTALARGDLPESLPVHQVARVVRDALGACSVPTAQEVIRYLHHTENGPIVGRN